MHLIFADDHSRVILTETWNDGDTDYINANFIKVKYIPFKIIKFIFHEYSFLLVDTRTCFTFSFQTGL